jgi:hypothetical protein
MFCNFSLTSFIYRYNKYSSRLLLFLKFYKKNYILFSYILYNSCYYYTKKPNQM